VFLVLSGWCSDLMASADPVPASSVGVPEEGRVVLEAEEDKAAGIPPADLKIILLGDSAVGKSKLVERYLLDKYKPRTRSTFALTLYRFNTTVPPDSSVGEKGGAPLAVDFWDTAGQERFASMHPSYYYRAQACVLVFDVTRKATYQHLVDWYKELRSYCPSIPCFVVANKIDVNEAVTSKKFAFPANHGLPLFYVSAADGTNVVRVFEESIQAAWKHKHHGDDLESMVYRMLDDPAYGTEAKPSS
jgi:Rab-like protein 2